MKQVERLKQRKEKATAEEKAKAAAKPSQ